MSHLLGSRDYRDSLGYPAVHVLPANQSTLLADSRQREDPNSSAMHFKINCDRIRMKEFYYNTLYWKQSLFTHNLNNCELLFQFQYQGQTSPTYVVYSMPFTSFTSFDGNPPGSVYTAPNPDEVSYGLQLEWALNNDVRKYASNVLVVNYTGDAWCPPGGINVCFRYSSSRGYALWATPVNGALTDPVTVKILQCDFIKNGYTIHGFGYPYPGYQDGNSGVGGNTPVYGPNPDFQVVYYGESQPTLLPFRYIVIQSPELTKDRRIPSFHSSNASGFNNEIAIFALKLQNSGVWHAEIANEDSTVVSIRENYSPESATFIISSEFGKELTTSLIFNNWLSDGGILATSKISMVQGTYGGCRCEQSAMSYLLFNNFNNFVAGYFSLKKSNNFYGNAVGDAPPDDVSHEVTVIIKDN